VKRVAIVASASGNGKTTLGRELAKRLDLPFVEMDALVHGPNWAETPDDELRRAVEPMVASEAWVIDGTYRGKLGNLIAERAEVVVWLDLPIRVWLPRLLRRTVRRIVRREELWNSNRETLRGAFFSRDSLILFACRQHFRRRRVYPSELASFKVVRLRSQREVAEWLAGVSK
jgi:adenylate kinase family enzyme